MKIEAEVKLKKKFIVNTTVEKIIIIKSKCQDCQGELTVFHNPKPQISGELTFVCYKCDYRINISIEVKEDINN